MYINTNEQVKLHSYQPATRRACLGSGSAGKGKQMAYRDYINEKKSQWIGKSVIIEGQKYNVVDVDYNGCLLLNKPAQFTNTTAVESYMVKVV